MPIIFFGFLVVGPILFMVIGNAYSGFIISNTSDETFEKEFIRIPEVALFVETYPEYVTFHYGDFLGWKIINYSAKINDVQGIHMEVKKSMLHQGVRISAGCDDSGFDFVYDIPQEQVLDYLKNKECLRK